MDCWKVLRKCRKYGKEMNANNIAINLVYIENEYINGYDTDKVKTDI